MIQRTVIIALLVTAVSLATVVVRNQHRIAGLRETIARLAAAADASEPDGHRPRPRDPSGADESIAAILDHARDLEALDSLPEPERLERVAAATARIQQMNAHQLRNLHDALLADEDVAPGHRDALGEFILIRLAQTHPNEAFNRVLEHPTGAHFAGTLGGILTRWAIDAPDQACAALDGHDLPSAFRTVAQTALITGMLVSDPATARRLSNETGIPLDSLAEHARSEHLSPAQEDAAMAVLWSWEEETRPTAPDPGKADYPVAKRIPGRPGFVISPHTHLVLDVRDHPSGTLLRDPGSPGAPVFRVP